MKKAHIAVFFLFWDVPVYAVDTGARVHVPCWNLEPAFSCLREFVETECAKRWPGP